VARPNELTWRFRSADGPVPHPSPLIIFFDSSAHVTSHVASTYVSEVAAALRIALKAAASKLLVLFLGTLLFPAQRCDSVGGVQHLLESSFFSCRLRLSLSGENFGEGVAGFFPRTPNEVRFE